MQLKNTHVLVTGGAGFIGSHIVYDLLKENVKQIVVLDNFIRGHRENLKKALKDKRVKLIKGDIRNKALVGKLTKGIDIVFHQAALRHNLCTQDPRLCHEILVGGTFNVFEAAAACKVKKIVFASSASVYGAPKRLPMLETDQLYDNTMYGASKIYAERLAIAYKSLHNLSYVGLRYFNVYGPKVDIYGDYPEVLVRWLGQLKKNEVPIINGTGEQTMDFIYVEDVARANLLAAKSKVEEGIFNVGSGKETSLKELLELVLKLTGSTAKPRFKPALKNWLADHRRASTKLVKKQLGFTAQTNLRDGLKMLINWYNEETRNA